MEVEKLSVREFVERIKVGQLWATVAVIAGLVALSFTIGSRWSTAISEIKLNSLEAELRQERSNVKKVEREKETLQDEMKKQEETLQGEIKTLQEEKERLTKRNETLNDTIKKKDKAIGILTYTPPVGKVHIRKLELVQSPEEWRRRAESYHRTDSDIPLHTRRRESDPIVLRRRYYSRNKDDGPFGRGWNYSFGARIEIDDATVGRVVYRNELGEHIVFEPKSAEYVEILKTFVEEVSLGTKLTDVFESEMTQSRLFLTELSQSPKLRYIGMGLRVAELRFIGERIEITVGGGTSYFFDRKGRFRSVQMPSEPTIEIRYDPIDPNRVVRVMSVRASLDFEYNAQGRVKAATYEDGTRYEYTYREDGLLVTVSVNGETRISYDYDDRDRLTGVMQPEDPEPLIIRYSGDVRTELVRKPEHIRWEFEWPHVIMYRSTGDAEPHRTKFTFDEVNDSLTMEDAKWAEPKIYRLTACRCNPLDVTQFGKTTFYTYNDLGQVTRIEMPSGERIEVEYHPEFFKVTSVTTRAGPDNNVLESGKFKYNDRGQLIEARNHKNQVVHLEYDDEGFVAMLKGDWNEKEYYFSYNELGKPNLIHVPRLGAVSIEYDYRGKVTGVDAKPAEESNRRGMTPRDIFTPLEQIMNVIELKEPRIDRDFTQIEGEL